MIVYVNDSYRALHKIMTGNEFKPSEEPELNWGMLIDRLVKRSVHMDDLCYNNMAIKYYMVRNTPNDRIYDILFSIVSTHIEHDIANKVINSSDFSNLLSKTFADFKTSIYESMKEKDPDFDIGNIYFFDYGRLNGFSDNGINVFVQLSDGNGIEDRFRNYDMAVEFGSYFGSYKLKIAYGWEILNNTILKGIEDLRHALLNISLNLIKAYILNLILVTKTNNMCNQDNVIN